MQSEHWSFEFCPFDCEVCVRVSCCVLTFSLYVEVETNHTNPLSRVGVGTFEQGAFMNKLNIPPYS
jgi:hypothetical protein